VTRLLLWRHGQTEWNAEGRVQGQSDIDLSDVGRAQAEAAAPRLAAQHPDLIVSSDLRRAANTAGALAAVTGLSVAYDARLRERRHGVWEGLTRADIVERWPAEAERWAAGLSVGLDVEELDELGKRVVTALQDIAGRAPGATIVVASHGAALRRATGVLLGWPDQATRTLGVLSNCHWVDLRLDAKRGWQLRAYNTG
jgi:broad specificity phosphatase PhoE